MTQRLYLGPIDAAYDASRDILISPACAVGQEAILEATPAPRFAGVTLTPAQIAQAQTEARALADALLPSLATDLNTRHNTSHGEIYWRILVMPWLLDLAQAVLKCRCDIQAAAESTAGQPTLVMLLHDPPDWNFISIGDLWEHGFLTAEFNWWLYSVVVRMLAPPHWQLQFRRVSPFAERRAILPTGRRHRFSHVYGTGRLAGVALHLGLELLGRVMPRRTQQPSVNAAPAAIPADIVAALERILACTRPSVLGADYAAFAAHAARQNYRAGAVAVVGNTLWYNETERFVAAAAVEAGETIVPVQHGGHYGYAQSHPMVAEIEYAQPAFITWGWQRHSAYRGSFLPLPSPMLSRLTGRHRETEASLILVGMQQRVRHLRLMSMPHDRQWLAYRQAKADFAQALDAATRPALRYRPGLVEAGSLEDAEWLLRHAGAMPVVTGDLTSHLQRARLVVLDHPGTTMAIAYVLGIPTICYWDRDAFPEAASAEPYFDALRDSGLLFHDAATAAAAVNAIWDNPSKFYKTTQNSRQAWLAQYGRHDRHWRSMWLKTLIYLHS